MGYAKVGGVHRSLTPRMIRFVAAWVKTGNGSQSAIAAGYSSKRADQTASDLLRHPTVSAAIQERIDAKLKSGASIALQVLETLMVSSQSDDVRFRAATAWLDRSGYRPREQVEVTHHIDRRSDRELMERIAMLQREISGKNAIPSHLEGQVVDNKDINICDIETLCDNRQTLTPTEQLQHDDGRDGIEADPADEGPPGEGGGKKPESGVGRGDHLPNTAGFEGSEKIPVSPEGFEVSRDA